MDFTVVKIILDHFTEFKLYKNLNCLLSLHVYGMESGHYGQWLVPMPYLHLVETSDRKHRNRGDLVFTEREGFIGCREPDFPVPLVCTTTTG